MKDQVWSSDAEWLRAGGIRPRSHHCTHGLAEETTASAWAGARQGPNLPLGHFRYRTFFGSGFGVFSPLLFVFSASLLFHLWKWSKTTWVVLHCELGFVREPKNVAVLGCLLDTPYFQAALNFGFFQPGLAFPWWRAAGMGSAAFPSWHPSPCWWKEQASGMFCSSHDESQAVFPYKYCSEKTNKTIGGWSLPQAPQGWKCPLGWWPGSVLSWGWYRDRDIGRDTAGSVWGRAGTGYTQTPKERGVQNGTAALGLVFPASPSVCPSPGTQWQAWTVPVVSPTPPSGTDPLWQPSHTSLNPQVWRCCDKIPTRTTPLCSWI